MFIPGIFEGIRPDNPKNPKEVIPKTPSANFGKSPLTQRDIDIGLQRDPMRVNMFSPAQSFGNGRGVEPCETGSIIHFRAYPGNPMNGLQVNQGYGRGQKLGLAYSPEHPLTGAYIRPVKAFN